MSVRKKRKPYFKRPEFILAAVLVVISVIGLFITPYDPEKMNILLKNTGPSLIHPFGCDNFGRDVLSRTMSGLSMTFMISLMILVFGGGIGVVIGAITGYFGGILDEIIMRVNDTLVAFPSILMGLIIVAITGSGARNIVIAIGILFIPSFARIMRSEVIKQKNIDYVRNARNMGVSSFRIIFVHILPNTLSVLLPSLAIGFNNAVLAEAGMRFLGLGVQPPKASLGSMLSEASGYLAAAPWNALAPGFVMMLMILSFSLMAEKLSFRRRSL